MKQQLRRCSGVPDVSVGCSHVWLRSAIVLLLVVGGLSACGAPLPGEQGGNMPASAARSASRDGITLVSAATKAKTAPEVNITRRDFRQATMIFAPSTRPELFVDCVDHPYFPLIPGTVYHYEEATDEGLETTTVRVTGETRTIIGIDATVVHDTVRLEGEIIEDTRDWYAQDDRGNVWYLGEDSKEYENGQVVSTAGSWEAGVDGALPGIIMLGEPRPGDIYFQEYYPGEAEDMGAVMDLDQPVTVPYGSFPHTLITADFNPLDNQLEHKFYARGIGVVKTEQVGGGGVAVLVDLERPRERDDDERGCEIDDPDAAPAGSTP